MDASSPLLNEIGANVTLCDLDDGDEKYPSCVPSQADRDEDKKLTDLLMVLKRMEVEKNNFEEMSIGINMTEFEHQLPNLENIQKLKKEVKQKIYNLGVSRLVQKVRVCSKRTNEFFRIKNENLFRIGTLIVILLLVAIAAWATYRLHKIASYKVSFGDSIVSLGNSFRCSLKNPKALPAG